MKSDYKITKSTFCGVGTSAFLVGASGSAIFYYGLAISPIFSGCLYMYYRTLKKANKESSEIEVSVQQNSHVPVTFQYRQQVSELSNIVIQDHKVSESKNEIRR